ncbi:TetR/AcrR family transcriptional regulator [Nocardia sp. IBHARD005]|uniref:TetR/AcrR family transcriptional regulator n=1 Tax=Nocardia sp. IBHARD005 TaxID=3457765 RepID=UPI00405927C4
MDVGVRLFQETPFDAVTLDDVAASADVSRALMYHYFPTKGDFFGAIWKRAHDELLETARMDGERPVRELVEHSLRAHLDFYSRHAALVYIANRSAISTDPAVRGPVSDDLTAICTRILAACGATGRARDLAGAALAGWIAFVREVAIEWLLHQRISGDDVLALCMDTLDGAVGPHLDLGAPPIG